MSINLLGGPEPTLLPADLAVNQEIAAGTNAYQIATKFPAAPLAWALAANLAWQEKEVLKSYAFARVGYHRSLDLLRKNGWKGHGLVPWSHEPNRGFLMCLNALGRAAKSIGETDEVERIYQFIQDSSPIHELDLSWFSAAPLR
jgi:hypothetical protein